MASTSTGERRPGQETRAEILRVALQLFIARGYEATSTRDISSALGMTKSSLYYHFRNKEEIVATLMQERRAELDAFVEWLAAQPAEPGLLPRAVQRWLDGTTPDRLQTMRLAHANAPLMRRMTADGEDVRSAFDRVIDLLVPADAGPRERLLVRMAFDTAGAALLAAEGAQVEAEPEDVLAVARQASEVLAQAAEKRLG